MPKRKSKTADCINIIKVTNEKDCRLVATLTLRPTGDDVKHQVQIGRGKNKSLELDLNTDSLKEWCRSVLGSLGSTSDEEVESRAVLDATILEINQGLKELKKAVPDLEWASIASGLYPDHPTKRIGKILSSAATFMENSKRFIGDIQKSNAELGEEARKDRQAREEMGHKVDEIKSSLVTIFEIAKEEYEEKKTQEEADWED